MTGDGGITPSERAFAFIFVALAVSGAITYGRDHVRDAEHQAAVYAQQANAWVHGRDWTPDARTAGSTLAKDMTVAKPRSLGGYSRAAFPHWTDPKGVDWGGNGCDTRDDVLRHTLDDVAYVAGSTCKVASGVLAADPYTGKRIVWRRGVATSAAIQIDHVVPLAEAWRSGAASWATAERERFANDPRNLLAVDGPTNEAKGDSDPAEWLPPRKAERCDYVRRFVAVKDAYHLTVDPAEFAAETRVLADC